MSKLFATMETRLRESKPRYYTLIIYLIPSSTVCLLRTQEVSLLQHSVSDGSSKQHFSWSTSKNSGKLLGDEDSSLTFQHLSLSVVLRLYQSAYRLLTEIMLLGEDKIMEFKIMAGYLNYKVSYIT